MEKNGHHIIKRTTSICPQCGEKIDARITSKNHKIYIEKDCKKHGFFQDVYWSNKSDFERAERFRFDGQGLGNPQSEENLGCPFDCGICPQHKSATLLAIIDLTNRCNLKCPICFAQAAEAKNLYEPTGTEVLSMLRTLRKNKPFPAPALQFSGGEPTLREDLPELIKAAKTMGFIHVEVNTNGIKLSQDAEYCRSLKEAGVDTIYLQFDGLTPDIYIKTRGRDLVEMKMRAIENCRLAGIHSIVLVVTLIKGINEHQLGDIVHFAADNFEVIRCINVQPLSFSGRTLSEDLKKYRITIPDFMKCVEEQTGGKIRSEDFYPVPCVVPISKVAGALMKENFPEFTAHPHCGMATYFFLEHGNIVAITEYAQVDKFLNSMKDTYSMISEGKKFRAKIKILVSLRFLKLRMLKKYLWPILFRGSFEALERIHNNMILLSSMHFMDVHNFDCERVSRCVIHYAVPDGRLIPFCSYNNLGYRKRMEETE